jgi:hypothetical protein
MTTNTRLTPRLAFWGICTIAIAWLAASLFFELHLGVPTNGTQWLKRAVGWGVEVMLIRALFLGTRRYRVATQSPQCSITK